MKFSGALAAGLMVSVMLGACSSAGPKGRDEGPGPQARGGGPSAFAANPRSGDRMLKQARAAAGRGDCASATPIFRMLAGAGKGYEVAQRELSQCLIKLSGDAYDANEQRLLIMEARLWAERAAFAGDALAQKKLAEDLAAGKGHAADPGAALTWALVFNANGQRDGLGMTPLDEELFLDPLRKKLDEDALSVALADAKAFRILEMGNYFPKFQGAEGEEGIARVPPPEGRNRRRQ